MSDFKRGDCNTCTLLIAKLSEMAIEYGDEDSDNNSPDANCCIGSIKNDLHELERFVKENMASGFKTFEDLEFIAVSERSGVAFINFHNGYRISVDEDLMAAFLSFCQKNGLKMSSVIEKSIREYLLGKEEN